MPAPFKRGTQITRYVSLGTVLHFFLCTSLSGTSHGTTDRFLCINNGIVAPINRTQCAEQISDCGLVNTNSVTWCQLHTELVIGISIIELLISHFLCHRCYGVIEVYEVTH